MAQNKEVNINWLRVNVPQIVSIILGCSAVIWYISGLSERIGQLETKWNTTNTVSDKTFATMQKRLDLLDNIPLRMDLVERGLQSTNQRVDQYLTTLGSKIDSVTSQVNSVNTKVEVLNNKMDLLLPEKQSHSGTLLRR